MAVFVVPWVPGRPVYFCKLGFDHADVRAQERSKLTGMAGLLAGSQISKTGMARRMNSSKSGTVKAMSPWEGL